MNLWLQINIVEIVELFIFLINFKLLYFVSSLIYMIIRYLMFKDQKNFVKEDNVRNT